MNNLIVVTCFMEGPAFVVDVDSCFRRWLSSCYYTVAPALGPLGELSEEFYHRGISYRIHSQRSKPVHANSCLILLLLKRRITSQRGVMGASMIIGSLKEFYHCDRT